MQRFGKTLWWLIGGTRGGKNRLRIIMALDKEPMNTNSLSESLDLDYKTIQHHLELMEKHNVITVMGEGYGKNYFLTEQMEENMDELKKIKEKAGVDL